MNKPAFLECDFHTHTEFSGETQARGFTLKTLFETADKLKMRYIGYSEHWHISTSPSLFCRIREELTRLQPYFRTRIFFSAEIDALNSRGDLAVDPAEAAKILDYVSVAISHYGAEGVEQLKKDKIEDTLAMIQAVCRIPEVTMLMHPQIVYGANVNEIDRIITRDVYADAVRAIVENNKVVDYPSVEMSQDYLRLLIPSSIKLSQAEQSFSNFTRTLIAQKARLAPGSDAHHIYWPGSSKKWLGNNQASLQELGNNGYNEEQLWYFENR